MSIVKAYTIPDHGENPRGAKNRANPHARPSPAFAGATAPDIRKIASFSDQGSRSSPHSAFAKQAAASDNAIASTRTRQEKQEIRPPLRPEDFADLDDRQPQECTEITARSSCRFIEEEVRTNPRFHTDTTPKNRSQAEGIRWSSHARSGETTRAPERKPQGPFHNISLNAITPFFAAGRLTSNTCDPACPSKSIILDLESFKATQRSRFSQLVNLMRNNPHMRLQVCRARFIDLRGLRTSDARMNVEPQTERGWIVGAPWALPTSRPRFHIALETHFPFTRNTLDPQQRPAGMIRVPDTLFLAAIFHAWGKDLVTDALNTLKERFPSLTAERTLSRRQKHLCLFFGTLLLSASLTAPMTAWVILSAMATVLFAIVVVSRSLGLRCRQRRPLRIPLSDADLPVYTVLVPLYRETAVIDQLLTALSALDYPRDKLDAKLVIEASDQAMIEAISRRVLPPWIEVITVPDIGPRTKPKALAYALHFARGEYVTVFDAEDIPDPRQLRLAAETFAALPSSVVCLQARLGWYNAQESFFSRMLAVDYAAHFEVILPWLAARGWPLPLGGTSNHFRIKALKASGGWDPYNVTEDADLGLRLARCGWRALVIPSRTMEEACVTWRSWKAQRARWLKGWLQTWLVHARDLRQLRRVGGWGACFVLHGIIGAGVLSALMHPLCLAVLLRTGLTGEGQIFVPENPFSMLSVFVLAGGYGLGILTAAIGLARSGQRHLYPWLALLPLYWLMISAAAWLAVWDLVRRPHHWRKTDHGLSRMTRLRNRALSGLWAPGHRDRLRPLFPARMPRAAKG